MQLPCAKLSFERTDFLIKLNSAPASNEFATASQTSLSKLPENEYQVFSRGKADLASNSADTPLKLFSDPLQLNWYC